MNKLDERLEKLLDTDMSSNKKHTLAAVYEYVECHKDGIAIKYKDMAKAIGISLGGCKSAIKELEKNGLMTVSAQEGSILNLFKLPTEKSTDLVEDFSKRTGLRGAVVILAYEHLKKNRKEWVTLAELGSAIRYKVGTLKIVVTLFKKLGIISVIRGTDMIAFNKENEVIENYLVKDNEPVAESDVEKQLRDRIEDQDKLIEQLNHMVGDKNEVEEFIMDKVRTVSKFLKTHKGNVMTSVVESMVGEGAILDAFESIKIKL